MKRFLIATALAAVLGLGTSSKVQAQIVYGYTSPTYGGLQSTGMYYGNSSLQSYSNFYSPFSFSGLNSGTTFSPTTATTYSTYYSPYSGLLGQSYSNSIYGTSARSVYGYNPYTGYLSGTTYYQPNTFLNPYAGYSSNWARRIR